MYQQIDKLEKDRDNTAVGLLTPLVAVARGSTVTIRVNIDIAKIITAISGLAMTAIIIWTYL